MKGRHRSDFELMKHTLYCAHFVENALAGVAILYDIAYGSEMISVPYRLIFQFNEKNHSAIKGAHYENAEKQYVITGLCCTLKKNKALLSKWLDIVEPDHANSWICEI